MRLRYITQVNSRPPSFVAWCSRHEALPDSYQRYLVNGLREAFGLKGVPIRLAFRKGENPYAKKGWVPRPRPRRRGARSDRVGAGILSQTTRHDSR